MIEELRFLEEQGVNPALLKDVEEFRREYPVEETMAYRVVRPAMPDRLQGHVQERAGGESGMDFRPALLQRIFPCEHRQR